jgi:hypothetical protein
MIEDLGNNNWNIFDIKIYAPNIKTALERALRRDCLSDSEKTTIRELLKNQ